MPVGEEGRGGAIWMRPSTTLWVQKILDNLCAEKYAWVFCNLLLCWLVCLSCMPRPTQ